jgi:small-conductance mechanosensitive channel
MKLSNLFKFSFFFFICIEKIFSYDFINFRGLEDREEKSIFKSDYFELEKLINFEDISEYINFSKQVFFELESGNKFIKGFLANLDQLSFEKNKFNFQVDIFFRRFNEINGKIEKSKENLDRLIKEYEDLISHYFKEILIIKKSFFSSFKYSESEIKKLIILIETLYDSINFLENNIEKINNEIENKQNSIKKISEIFYEKDIKKKAYLILYKRESNKNEIYKKKIIDSISIHKDYISILEKFLRMSLIIELKEAQLKYKINSTKKNFILEQIRLNKDIFCKAKDNLIMSEKDIRNISEAEKINQKEFFLKKINTNDLLKKLKLDYLNYFKKNLDDIDIIFFFDEIIKSFKNANNDFNFLEKRINELSFFIENEFIKSDIYFIEKNILNSDKNIESTYGLYLISMDRPSKKEMQELLDCYEESKIEQEIDYCNQQKDKISELMKKYIVLEGLFSFKKDKIDNYDILSLEMDKYKKIILRIINNYYESSLILKNIFYLISGIKSELSKKKFWSRSKCSIAFKHILSIIPENKMFLRNLKNGFKLCIKNFIKFFNKGEKIIKLTIINILVFIIVAAFIAIMFNYFLPKIKQTLMFFFKDSIFYSKISLLLDYFFEQRTSIYLWIVIYLMFSFYIIPSDYLATIFFILSIPFFFFIVNNFLNWFAAINKDRAYIFIAYNNVDKFIFMFRYFINSFVFLFFYREAFLRTGQLGSAFPAIILALQFIIFQIFIIFVLDKDKILNFVPEYNEEMIKFKKFVNQNYNFFLFLFITIIIMSNPYVGYGSQVLYFLTRTTITLSILPLFNNFFEYLKNKMFYFFFIFQDCELKSKIKGGKSIYTILTAILFFLIGGFYFYALYFIWGLDINFSIIKNVFYFNFLEMDSVDKEAVLSLSLVDIGRVFFYIFFGYIITYILNNFIMRKILNEVVFNIYLQNTIGTIIRYSTIFFMFIIGLYSSGLQSLGTKIAVFIGIIGFAIKEPFSDFISYFIILIQRPIKIGDYIRIKTNDVDVLGIVREITPRTTLIRQRNSQIVIIPNSFIITKLISNWNHGKSGFVATEDILFAVGFEVNSEIVRELLLKSLEECQFILKNPSPIVRFENFGASGYEFLVRCFIPSSKTIEILDITSQLRFLITKKLNDENIKISSPHCSVKIVGDNNFVFENKKS